MTLITNIGCTVSLFDVHFNKITQDLILFVQNKHSNIIKSEKILK